MTRDVHNNNNNNNNNNKFGKAVYNKIEIRVSDRNLPEKSFLFTGQRLEKRHNKT